MKKLVVICMLILLGVVAASSGCTGSAGASGEENEEILVYCGAGLREPMEMIADKFTEDTGVSVNYIYGGSNTILSQIELTGMGDVYMPGATYYFDSARDKGFVSEEKLVVYHIPVIATPKGNPANIQSLEDLGREGVKVELGDPSACAIGKLGNKIIEKNGLNETIYPNVITRAATVNEIVVHTGLGQVDGSIIWEDLIDPDKLDVIYIPNEQNIIKVVPIGKLTMSENPEEAQAFVDYVASDDGFEIFRETGFTTYPDSKYGEA